MIGRLRKNSGLLERPYALKRMKLFFDRGFAFYAEFSLRLFWMLLGQRKDLLYANDLDTLLPNFLISRISGVPLVYDSHEYFTEVPELLERPNTRSFWLSIEEFVFPRLNPVITVNEELARIYQERYRVPVEVIRNVPELIPGKNDVENSRGFRENHTLIYQGALNMGRGIELMIDSMPLLDDCTLILAGEGDISAALKTRVESKGLTDRILFKGRLDPKVLRDLTRTADLGLSLEEDLGLNYRYALPNKIFDYIHAGIPVVVSDLPVMGGFVREHKVGEILSDRSPEALARRVREVLSKRETYSPCLNAAALEFNWDNEKVKFLKLLENLEKNLEHR